MSNRELLLYIWMSEDDAPEATVDIRGHYRVPQDSRTLCSKLRNNYSRCIITHHRREDDY